MDKNAAVAPRNVVIIVHPSSDIKFAFFIGFHHGGLHMKYNARYNTTAMNHTVRIVIYVEHAQNVEH